MGARRGIDQKRNRAQKGGQLRWASGWHRYHAPIRRQENNHETLRSARDFFLAVFVTNTVTTGHAQNHKQCSNASAAGRWAFTSTGTLILPTGPVPVAAVATFTEDASGNLSGSQTRSLGGDVADETFTGTTAVNPDCTATYVVAVLLSGALVRTTTLHVVFDDNLRSGRGIFTALALANGASLPTVITLDAKRLFSRDED